MSSADTLISSRSLQQCLHDPDLRIVDCRFDLMQVRKGRQDYLKQHIPGAAYADLDRDLSAPVTADTGRHPLPAPTDLVETLRRIGIENQSQIVVYDQGSGAIAARLWWMLRWMGHDEVRLLDGGFAEWCRLGFDTESGQPVIRRGNFNGSQRTELVIDCAELAAELRNDDAPLLIDARDADRFDGLVEPIDALAGHIPGARNYPFTNNLTGEGKWHSPSALSRDWDRAFGTNRSAPAIAMCGSGVTACHLVIAAKLAGRRQPRLYAGSWSEWIRDPDRPVVTGGGSVPCGPLE